MKCSIIMPVYNGEAYLEQAINSVLDQTLQDFELIIVNDGSTDTTASIVSQFKNDNRIKYVYQENQGESAARNKGLRLAKGEFIAFIDADDIYDQYKIEKQIRFLEDNIYIDIVYCDVQIIDSLGNPVGRLKSEKKISEKENFLAYLLYRQIIPGPAAIMIRRKCIETGISYPVDFLHAEDYQFTLSLAQHYQFGYLEEALYLYRRHENNLTNNHVKQQQSEKEIIRLLGYEKIYDIVEASTYPSNEKKLLLTKILLKMGDLDQALVNLKDLDEQSEALFLKGNILYKLNKNEEALNCFNNSNKLEVQAELYNNLGCVHYKLGNVEEAINSFKQALILRSDYGDPKMNLQRIEEGIIPKLTEKKLRVNLTNYKD